MWKFEAISGGEDRIRAIGFMSGTSLDGVDAAGIVTDGDRVIETGPSVFIPYSTDDQAVLSEALKAAQLIEGRDDQAPVFQIASQVVFDRHIEAFDAIRGQNTDWVNGCSLIGFHGQTVVHKPDIRFTYQVGSPRSLADALGIPVVGDLRLNDVKSGGEGAPLVPAYHGAVAHHLSVEAPVVFVNIGGVANITSVETDLLAFDTGPGNALIDDWVRRHDRGRMDEGGKLGLEGKVEEGLVREFLANSFFDERPPKSLDRDSFTLEAITELSLEDGCATLAAMTGAAIAKSERWMRDKPGTWILLGGGRKNQAIVSALQSRVSGRVIVAEEIQTNTAKFRLDGDMLEAQAFAYLAVRSVKGLPITFPGTTGVDAPLTGGALFTPSR
ncbi:MAG: anhydro-N-acetylmuramic acid kinase [Pseudomonadota bacterium]